MEKGQADAGRMKAERKELFILHPSAFILYR